MLEFAYLLLFLLVVAAGLLLYQIMSKISLENINDAKGLYSILNNIKGGTGFTYIIDFANYQMYMLSKFIGNHFRIKDTTRHECTYNLLILLLENIFDVGNNKVLICITNTNHLLKMRLDYVSIKHYIIQCINDRGVRAGFYKDILGDSSTNMESATESINDKLPDHPSDKDLIDELYKKSIILLYRFYMKDISLYDKFKDKIGNIEIHFAYAPFIYCSDIYFGPEEYHKRIYAVIPKELGSKLLMTSYVKDNKYMEYIKNIAVFFNERRDNMDNVNEKEYRNIIKGSISRDDFLCLYLKLTISEAKIYSNDQYKDRAFIIDYMRKFDYYVIKNVGSVEIEDIKYPNNIKKTLYYDYHNDVLSNIRSEFDTLFGENYNYAGRADTYKKYVDISSYASSKA